MINPQLEPSQTANARRREARIMVVDDEKPMRMMARVIVESLGFDAIEASSGEEAILLYREHYNGESPIDLVIMDLALPGGISGIEATQSLKEIDPNASVLVSSGYLSQNSRQAAMQQGFAGVLPKPYTVDRLASEIHYILNHRDTLPR